MPAGRRVHDDAERLRGKYKSPVQEEAPDALA
jgi:hypothetical protein